MDLKESQILGEDINTHWYYVSKFQALKKIITNVPVTKLLDVGAGSAFFSKSLLEVKDVRESCCVDISYENEYEDNVDGKKIQYVKSIHSYDASLVLMMDVIEHVENDVDLLKEYINKVPSGCYFLISVPAFQWLWSGHDEFLDHKRRYSLQQLEQTVNQSGLQILNSQYFYAGVFPLVVMLRLLEKLRPNRLKQSQLKRHSAFVNSFLLKLSNFESSTLVGKNKLFGLTVFCLAKKE